MKFKVRSKRRRISIRQGVRVIGLVGLFVAAPCAQSQTWIQTSAPDLNWVSLASSSNAGLLAALPGSKSPLPMYLSTNSGVGWFTNGLPSNVWGSVAMSADGRIIKASEASYHGNTIWTTTNAGADWRSDTAPISGPLACSADGTRWAMADRGSLVYTSTNMGVSWISNSIPNTTLAAVASSANGDRLIAAGTAWPGSHGGPIFTSTNAGATWQTTSAPLRTWTSVASSAAGDILVAVATYTAYTTSAICVSTNGGRDWAPASAPAYWWSDVAVSADGSRMLAAAHYGATPQLHGWVFASTNSGTRWSQSGLPSGYWDFAATSADASKLVVASGAGSGAGIYVWAARLRLEVAAANAGLLVSWPSVAAADGYVLEINSDLRTSGWINAGLPVSDDGSNRTVLLGQPLSRGFCRLRKP